MIDNELYRNVCDCLCLNNVQSSLYIHRINKVNITIMGHHYANKI